MNERIVLIFDWGGTVMVDYDYDGAMYTWEKVDAVTGVIDALKYLSARFRCCIATNADFSGSQDVIKALKRIDADKYFEDFFLSKEIGVEKPKPGFFLHITKKMNVNPVNCIMIGNNYDKDIVGAKQAGMKTIFYSEDLSSYDLPAADEIIHSMDELVQKIKNISFD